MKLLICYEVGSSQGNERRVVTGHCYATVKNLTQKELERIRDEAFESFVQEYRKQFPECSDVKFTVLCFRSVLPLNG